MEDFNKQLKELKDNVIAETGLLVSNTEDCRVAFAYPVTCYVTHGDACYFTASNIRYNDEDGHLFLYGDWPNGDAADGISINYITAESCVAILDKLQDTIRDANTKKLHSLRERYPDGIKCDGTFTFRSVAVEGFGCTLDGNIVLDFTDNGESCYKIINEDKLTNEELDGLLAYVEGQLEQQIDISLTPAQQTAVEKFKAALKELEEQKVVIIEDHCTDKFAFANGDGIEYMDSECYDENTEGYFSVDKQVGELDSVEIADFAYFSDSALVLAKKD